MADFSFVEGGLERKEPGGAVKQVSAAPGPSRPPGASPRITIPSFSGVQQSERQLPAPINLFRASGSGDQGRGSFRQPPQQQQQQQQQGTNAFAFLDTGPAPRPRPAGPPAGGAAPPFQQGQQPRPGWPHQPEPSFQQPAGASAAGAAPRPGFGPGFPAGAGPHPPLAAPYPPAHPSQPPQQQHYHHPQQQQQQQHYGPRPGAPPHPPPQQAQQQAGAAGFPPNAIIVSRRQEGNPLLRHIRNVRWQFGDIVPDYLIGKDAAALFISLRYHLLKPDYIHQRIRELQRSFRLRIILCHVDTEDAVEPLAQVTRAAIGNDCTLICAWSNQECARYLETFKSYENKPAEVIQKEVGSDYLSRINAALTTVRGVNKTDVKTLGDRFGSVSAIFKASAEELQRYPGIGPTKAKRLADAFREPFRKNIAAAGGPSPAMHGRPNRQQQQQQAGGQQQQAQPQAQPQVQPQPLHQVQQAQQQQQAQQGAHSPQHKQQQQQQQEEEADDEVLESAGQQPAGVHKEEPGGQGSPQGSEPAGSTGAGADGSSRQGGGSSGVFEYDLEDDVEEEDEWI